MKTATRVAALIGGASVWNEELGIAEEMMKEKLQDGHKQQGRWILAPLADIAMPKPGRICYGPRWWAVTENNEVLFFDRYSSPQCNTNKAIVERLGSGFDAPVTRPVFVDIAFLPHQCSDYA